MLKAFIRNNKSIVLPVLVFFLAAIVIAISLKLFGTGLFSPSSKDNQQNEQIAPSKIVLPEGKN
jgi:nucleoside recognition membrane protein YjiH